MKPCSASAALFVFAALLPAAIVRGVEADCELIDDYRIFHSTSGAFIIQYGPGLERLAREFESLLERSAGEIAGELGLETIAPVCVYITGGDETFRKLRRREGPEGAAAFSAPGARMLGVHARLATAEAQSLERVARHELSHLLLYDRCGIFDLPTWFIEGLAMMQSGKRRPVDEWNFMLLVGRGRVPYLEELAGPFPHEPDENALAYALSYHAVSRLFAQFPGSLPTLTAFIRDREDFEDAFFMTYGMTPYEYASRFYVIVHERYKIPGTILNASPYWLAAAALLVTAYLSKRARMKRRLREMEERETAPPSFSS